MPTARHVYVDPNAGGSGVGTSWTNAYTSLNTAEQTEDNTGDLVTRDEFIVFHCRASSGGADTAAVNVSGWTTSATQYIEIHCGVNACRGGAGDECVTANRHGGVWDATKYRLAVDNSSALIVSEEYVRVDGVQSYVSTSSGNLQTPLKLTTTATCDIRISNSILRHNGTGAYTQPGLDINVTTSVASIWNCIIYGSITAVSANNAGILISGGTTAVKVYSCTVIGGYYGIRVNNSQAVTAKNCYFHGSNAATNLGTGASITSTSCATSGTTLEVDNVAHSTATFVNVTATTEDYRLAGTSSGLYDVGTDTSGDAAPLNFTVDIAGQTRA